MLNITKRLALCAASASMAFAGLGLLGTAAKAAADRPSARTAVPSAAFSRAIRLTGPANSSAVPQAFLFTVSCSRFGSCAAGGTYDDSLHHAHAMAISERSGRWARGVALRMPADAPAVASSRVNGMACRSAGSCTAVGDYPKAGTDAGRVFAVNEIGGRWRRASEIKLPVNAAAPAAAGLTGLSCPSRSACVAVGGYTDNAQHFQAMVVVERQGAWRPAVELSLPPDAAANPLAELNAVACQSTGHCVAVGSYTDTLGHERALGGIESNGHWTATAISLPPNADGTFTTPTGITCSQDGHCVIVGEYRPTPNPHVQAMSAVEFGGHFSAFSQVKAVPTGAVIAGLHSVSCLPSGQCVAVGNFTASSGRSLAYSVVRSASGNWSHAAAVQEPRGALTTAMQAGFLDAVSCLTGGCTAAGFYRGSNFGLNAMAAIRR
jgi:hypothetical protein